MSVPPVGYHKIKTSSGKYLTLLTQTGTLTAMPDSGATNQTWDFQLSEPEHDWTVRNTGYTLTTYAHSNGQIAAPVAGNALDTKWIILPHDGVYAIQLVSKPPSDPPKSWSLDANDQVTLGDTQLMNPLQQFNIE